MKQKLIFLFVILQMQIACAQQSGDDRSSQANAQNQTNENNNQQENPKASKLMMLTPTIYYRPVIHSEQSVCEYSEVREFIDVQGAPILKVCRKDYKKCLMQGSCIVEDTNGRHQIIFQYENNGQYYFAESTSNQCPYGFGVRNICLDPFFSVAADFKFFKPGDVIYVEKLKGLPLPDGQIHDGYLIVRDDGGRILGDGRFDFFTGELNYLDRSNPFARIGLSDKMLQITYEKITDPLVSETVRKNRGYPGISKQLQ